LVALSLTLDHPSATAGLVLVSGYYYPTLRADVALAACAVLPVLGDLLRYTVLPPLSRLSLPQAFNIMFYPNKVPPTIEHGFVLEFAVRPSQLAAQNGDGAIMVDTVAALEVPLSNAALAGRHLGPDG
jgi:hypothetical protein